ncbi:unnamed protein product [Cylicocyclus nassatus]|uniref:SKP1 component dimerisation domain-containing protein n=1 Tax=Cylicocyclus nassatus TaxID=53992 RepID=A0AA36GXA4_CYLNA|nr:unnamed protein product [Cylicocyclus nassatus]
MEDDLADEERYIFFYIHKSLEEAVQSETNYESGLRYVRFQVLSTMIFDVLASSLLDLKIISRGFRQSSLMGLTDESVGPMLNRDPIKIPFEEEEFQKFLFAVALVRNGGNLINFKPAEVCSILKIADYFEANTMMRRAIQSINKHLVGKNPSQICKAFNIESDVTKSQKRQMEQEGLWNFNT